jgi:serine/threonine protein kinase/WD40 repeat protein
VPSEELTGRTLGDFVVRHRLGEGGYGAVYRAEQPLLGREAVVKVLHDRLRHSKTVIQRFLREARLASKLDHPYAAHIYAFGVEQDGLMWIAMEYVRGETLHELLRRRGALPLEELVPLLDRICEVLQAAHELGIVHRDIKPPNVMVVQRSGRVFPKLLDFGVAKLTGDEVAPSDSADSAPAASPSPAPTPTPTVATPSPPRAKLAIVADAPEVAADATVSFVGQPGGALGGALAARAKRPSAGYASTIEAAVAAAPPPPADEPALTEAGVAVGSPPYMAPEQWDDSAAATARTDIYALGVLTYEALTGRRPFVGATLAAYALAHATQPVPPLGGVLPAALDEVLERALAKEPGERFASALEFAQAFRAAAGFGSQPLPQLDDDLRQSVEASFPQPIAEAVAAFQAARNAHQGRDALREIAATAIRYVAMIAVAAQAQVRLAEVGSSIDLVRELRRRTLRDEEWLQLARELIASFRTRAQAHPMPELVALLAASGEGDPLTVLAQARTPDHDPLATIRELLPHVTRLLRALAFLADYPLVVADDGRAESWMGLRRPRRVALEVHGRAIEPGQPVLLDASSRPVVALWPIVQTSSPMPGAPAELFLLDGAGRRGARLVAKPNTLERQDERVWDWLAETFAWSDRDTPVSPDHGEAKPYRGLAAFTAQDADAFVGREREVDAAVNRLATSALVAVVGPSGAGKSSFVHAGILPSLPAGWTALSVRPGATPLATLESRLKRGGVDLADPGERTIVLVVDQFEELFTLGATADERSAFLRTLLAAEDHVRVILTLRDDFLGRATQLPELRDRLPTALFLLGTPARADLVRILIQPLAKLGFDFDDPALPGRMVDAVADTPGALALLSFTAAKLWELRDRRFRQLTRSAHDAIGGVAGALAQHAETTLSGLSPHEQRLARTALGHLVTAEGTRAVLTRGELDQLLRDPAASSVLEKLIAARLLVTTETETGAESVEIVHEALLSAWPRLAQWRREDAEGVRLRDQVRAAARQWVERDRPRGLLWRDDALAELQVWRTRHAQPLTMAEDAFVGASLAEASRGRRLRRGVIGVVIGLMAVAVAILVWARDNAQRTAARDRERTRQALVEQGRNDVLAGNFASARAAFAEARGLGVADSAALRFLENAAEQPIRARTATLRGHRARISDVQFSPDGRRVLTASADGTARMWDAVSGAPLGVMRGCVSASFDPTGQHIETECDDGVVRIYTASDTRLEHELALARGSGAPGPSVFAWFSPDGGHLVTSFAGMIERWDVASGRREWAISGQPQGRIVTSPDGKYVASLCIDQPLAMLWDAATGALVATLQLTDKGWQGRGVFPTALAFDPSGTRLFTVARRTTSVQIWDVATHTLLGELDGGAGAIAQLRVTRDGQRVAIASHKALQIWSLATRTVEHTLPLDNSPRVQLAFSSDDRLLGVTRNDGALALWDVASGMQVASVQGHAGAVWAVAFDPSADRVVSAGVDATAIVWDLRAAARMKVIVPNIVPNRLEVRGDRFLVASNLVTVRSVRDGRVIAQHVIGPNGDARFLDDRRVAFLDQHGGLSFWDLSTDTVREVAHHKHAADWIAIDHDVVASWAGDELIAVDASTGAVMFRWTAPADVTSVAIVRNGIAVGYARGGMAILDRAGHVAMAWHANGSVSYIAELPDGRLVTASSVVQLWSRGRALAELAHPTGDIMEIAVSHTGRRLATSGLDGTVRVWDLLVYGQIWELHHTSAVALGFSDDDQFLTTLDEEGTVRVWSVAAGEELFRLMAVPTRGLIGLAPGAIVAAGLTSIAIIPLH